jgi:hypothetical protein
MKTLRNIALLLCLSALALAAPAQNTGSIKGSIRDSITGETLPGAHAYIKIGQNMIGTSCDANGEFIIKPLQPGTYDVHFSYMGYGEKIMATVHVNADQITFLKPVKLVPGVTTIVTNIYPDPLINPDGGVKVVRAKDIEDLPIKNDVVRIITALSSDIIAADNGRDFSFRGARTGDATFIVDGIIIRGSDPSLPGGSISSITVYSGGIPAKYGDTTGGVVVIQTKSYFEWEAESKLRGNTM